MTARVRGILERRHVSAGKPRWGWVLVGKDPENAPTYDAIKSRHDRLLKKLALKRFRLYDMRHTFLTRLGESGANAFTIQKMAGHSSIMVSARYVHPTPERVEDAISHLEQYNQREAEAALARLVRKDENDAYPPQARKPGLVIRANFFLLKCRRAESNCRPKDYETFALTTELRRP